MIKLVVFDCGDLIYDFEGARKAFRREYASFLKDHGVEFKSQEKLWREFEPRVMRGKVCLEDAVRAIFRRLGLPESKAREWLEIDREIYLREPRLNKHVKSVLRGLMGLGIKVALLSDTVHSLATKLELLRRLGLKKDEHYDEVFLSNSMGYAKPHPRAYEIVLSRFKAKPHETLFVGHDEDEIEGAKRLGIRTISFKGCRGADFYIEDLREVLSIAKALKGKG